MDDISSELDVIEERNNNNNNNTKSLKSFFNENPSKMPNPKQVHHQALMNEQNFNNSDINQNDMLSSEYPGLNINNNLAGTSNVPNQNMMYNHDPSLMNTNLQYQNMNPNFQYPNMNPNLQYSDMPQYDMNPNLQYSDMPQYDMNRNLQYQDMTQTGINPNLQYQNMTQTGVNPYLQYQDMTQNGINPNLQYQDMTQNGFNHNLQYPNTLQNGFNPNMLQNNFYSQQNPNFNQYSNQINDFIGGNKKKKNYRIKMKETNK